VKFCILRALAGCLPAPDPESVSNDSGDDTVAEAGDSDTGQTDADADADGYDTTVDCNDSDGYGICDDCDDTDPNVYPGHGC
jgi:hypothetical protein